jgi:hypothetical protein
MTAKSHTKSKLLTRLCRDLSEANAALRSGRSSPRHAGTRQVASGIEDLVLDLITEVDLENDRLRAAMVASGSRKLITRLDANGVRRATLESAEWGRFLRAADPEMVKFALNGRAAPAGITIPLLGRLTGGDVRWIDLFYDQAQSQCDAKIFVKRNRQLLHAPKARPFVEGYLCKQVGRYRDHYREMAQNYVGQGDLVAFTLIHLAGIPIDDILRGYQSPRGFGHRLLADLGSSNHRRLAFYGRAASIEAVLANPAPILELQEALHQRAAA